TLFSAAPLTLPKQNRAADSIHRAVSMISRLSNTYAVAVYYSSTPCSLLLTSTPTYITFVHRSPPLPPSHDRFDIAESRDASLDPGCHRSAHNSTLVAPAPVALPLSRRQARRSRSRRSGRRKRSGCNRDHIRRRDTTSRCSNTNNRHRNERGGNCCAATNCGRDVAANSSVAPHYTTTHFHCA